MSRHALLLFAILTIPAMATRAAVTVTSSDPDQFTDAADRNSDPIKIEQSLERHLQKLGERYLPPQANLSIRILDLDRAGRPWRDLPTELRLINGKNDLPCIDLEWSLATLSTSTPPRRERVCDPNFLRSLGPGYSGYSEHDPLVYEKRMLEEWFRTRFSGPATRASSVVPPLLPR